MGTINPEIESGYKCNYCGKTFKRAATLEAHVCTKKQRALQKDEKRVRYGFYAFNRFNKLGCGNKKDVTYEQFCESQHYNAFVKFGSYLTNVKPLYPEQYIEYVIKSKLKIKDWCSDMVYEKYVIDLIKKEPANVAIERSINTMIKWSEENRVVWNHYFDYVNKNVGVWDIKDGKISPWIVLNTQKGKQLLSDFDDTQLDMIYNVIDPEYWLKIFEKNPTDVETVLLLADEYKL